MDRRVVVEVAVGRSPLVGEEDLFVGDGIRELVLARGALVLFPAEVRVLENEDICERC